jgi:hypothetical protein
MRNFDVSEILKSGVRTAQILFGRDHMRHGGLFCGRGFDSANAIEFVHFVWTRAKLLDARMSSKNMSGQGGLQMRDYEIDVHCPLCNAKTRLNRLMAHAKKSHPEVSALDFKGALDQKVRSDPTTVDLKRVTRSVDMVSATDRVRDVRDQHYTATFSGGAIEGGKKR